MKKVPEPTHRKSLRGQMMNKKSEAEDVGEWEVRLAHTDEDDNGRHDS